MDDVVAVYKELLKTYQPHSIGIFGTSAGAILTAQVTVRLKQLGSAATRGTWEFFLASPTSAGPAIRGRFSLSTVFPDGWSRSIRIICPTINMSARPIERIQCCRRFSPTCTGCRRRCWSRARAICLLSDTATFHRALLGAGDDAQLVVFEALPHAFWYHFQLPETKEALELMARFFDQKLAR